MSYPYKAVNDQSSFNAFDASGTTLVDNRMSHYRDDSQVGVAKKAQFDGYADPHIQNAEDVPLVRRDLGIFTVRLPFNNLSLLKNTQTPTGTLPTRRVYNVLVKNRPS